MALCQADGAVAGERGTIPGIATHDEAIIGQVQEFVQRKASGPSASSSRCSTASGGICRKSCGESGYNMRVYIPFGTQWYPYLMRRLAERPANIAFILGNIVKESVPGR